jgi:hypothetical protein
MGTFDRIGFTELPLEMEPVIGAGFEEGHLYDQVDLGSSSVVEGIARYYLDMDYETTSHFTIKALMHLDQANHTTPGRYIGFAGTDPDGYPTSYIYERIS